MTFTSVLIYFHKMALFSKNETEVVCTCVASSLGYSSLREHQKNVVTGFVDIFVILSTGYGKSLYYACLPGKFLNITNSTVVIIRFASD